MRIINEAEYNENGSLCIRITEVDGTPFAGVVINKDGECHIELVGYGITCVASDLKGADHLSLAITLARFLACCDAEKVAELFDFE